MVCVRFVFRICFLSRHHIHPKRHFPKQKLIASFNLCRECHDMLEIYIRKCERGKVLTKNAYENILKAFIKKRRKEIENGINVS